MMPSSSKFSRLWLNSAQDPPEPQQVALAVEHDLMTCVQFWMQNEHVAMDQYLLPSGYLT